MPQNSSFLRCVALRYVTLRYVTLRYVTLRYVTLRYVTLDRVAFFIGASQRWIGKKDVGYRVPGAI